MKNQKFEIFIMNFLYGCVKLIKKKTSENYRNIEHQ